MELVFIYASLLIVLAGSLAVLLSPARNKSTSALIFVILQALTTSVPALMVVISGNHFLYSFYCGNFINEVSLCIDGLSAWLILIINFTAINGMLYGAGYMKMYSGRFGSALFSFHWVLYLVFQASMLWVTIIGNSIAFLIVWEIMSVSSLLLLIFDHKNTFTLSAGLKYLIQMHIGVVFLTVAFLWIYVETGSFDFGAIPQFMSSHNNVWPFLLFFAGFGIKAGFIPVHTWLPYAHPAAPSHISGVMSGVIVKMGIYGILRIITFIQHDYILIGQIVMIVSVLTGLYGILYAAVQRDIKVVLAYCTIENIGIIGLGMGLGLIGMGTGSTVLIVCGFGGVLLHALNHSLCKSLLFFSAGSVYYATHTRDMEKLGGLAKLMPHTAALFLTGAIAITGLPPLNTFISEFLLYNGLLDAIKVLNAENIILMIFSVVGMALMGGLALLTFVKAFGIIFLGSSRTVLPHKPEEVPFLMRLPQYLTVFFMFLVVLFSGYFLKLTYRPSALFLPDDISFTTMLQKEISGSFSGAGVVIAIFVTLVVLFYLLRRIILRKRSQFYGPTWGCGYVAPGPAMQYTGRSFSGTLAKLFNFIITDKDFIERNVFDRIIRLIMRILNYFKFIQNGRVQGYVLYGLFFILLIFLLTLFRII